jgi:phosphorylcholine metabolism protein LicD
MDEKTVIESLSAVKDVLDRKGVTFWLEHGTLLGAVRDGKVMGWDSDVDLGAWYAHLPDLTATFEEFTKRGFNVVLNPKQGTLTVQKGDCNINFTLYRRRGNFAWTAWMLEQKSKLRLILQRGMNICNTRSYVTQQKTVAQKGKRFLSVLPSALKRLLADVSWLGLNSFGYLVSVVIPAHYFDSLSSLSFYGMQFSAPSDVEKYLEFRYGTDWRTPNKNWIYYRDDGAVDRNWDARNLGT